MAKSPVRLVILGTGHMAHGHAEVFNKIEGVSLVAGIDTREENLKPFCEKFKIPNSFSSVMEALTWGQFDAVTNVTPDAVHFSTTMAILTAGKHILCEKPLATCETEAEAMAEAAEKAGVVNMVNLSYRNVSALQHAAQMVREGAIGEIRYFEASYLQSWLVQPAWGHWQRETEWLWRLSTIHGSKGVLGDVGVHILDWVTFVAGEGIREISCRLATFHKAPNDQIGDYRLDANDSATMQLILENGALGTLGMTRFASGHLNDLRLGLYGTKGGLEVRDMHNMSRLRACLEPNLQKAEWCDLTCAVPPTIYERFIAAIRGECAVNPDFARGALLQKIVDRAEQSSKQGGLSLKV